MSLLRSHPHERSGAALCLSRGSIVSCVLALNQIGSRAAESGRISFTKCCREYRPAQSAANSRAGTPDLLDPGEVEWSVIQNLDTFFTRVYRWIIAVDGCPTLLPGLWSDNLFWHFVLGASGSGIATLCRPLVIKLMVS